MCFFNIPRPKAYCTKPKTRLGLFFRNQITKVIGVPRITKLAMGPGLFDRIDLPDYPRMIPAARAISKVTVRLSRRELDSRRGTNQRRFQAAKEIVTIKRQFLRDSRRP